MPLVKHFLYLSKIKKKINMSLGLVKQIERNIRIKMRGIQEGTLTPKESKIGFQFNRLKSLDEASYENLLSQYKQILK